MEKWQKIAEKMAGVEPGSLKRVAPELYERLNRMHIKCRQQGGGIVSRQIIAAEVVRWEDKS